MESLRGWPTIASGNATRYKVDVDGFSILSNKVTFHTVLLHRRIHYIHIFHTVFLQGHIVCIQLSASRIVTGSR